MGAAPPSKPAPPLPPSLPTVQANSRETLPRLPPPTQVGNWSLGLAAAAGGGGRGLFASHCAPCQVPSPHAAEAASGKASLCTPLLTQAANFLLGMARGGGGGDGHHASRRPPPCAAETAGGEAFLCPQPLTQAVNLLLGSVVGVVQ